MAESSVIFLLKKLMSLLEEEVKLLAGIRNEVVDVRDELESMKAFLRNADSMEDEDEGLKLWVKHVRELAHDAEDIIDEFLLRFERPQQPGLSGRLSKIARVIKTLKTRRGVASKLRKIKSRATTIYQRSQRYSHNWSSTERGPSSSADKYIHSLSELRNNARLVSDARLFGIEKPKEKLVNWFLEDIYHNVQLLAVVGMGGLGKTTLVNQVYKDARVTRRFPHRAWITVSQSFDTREGLLDIINQLFTGINQQVPQETYSKVVHSLKEDIKSFLCDKKYLIVLDDAWTINPWESLKYVFPDNNLGSRVVVVTRIGDVARTVTEDILRGHIHVVEPLTPDGSWDLFCARVFQGQPCPPDLEQSSRHILARCKGLPLAIVSISGLLGSKKKTKPEWERVQRNLGTELYGNNQLMRYMEKVISLSVNDLPYDLKSCFLYLSMFPEDWLYVKKHVIRLWMAEGFIQQERDETPEEIGDFYFNELVDRSLVQLVLKHTSNEEHSKFQVHDLVREILLQKSKNQNFGLMISEQNLRAKETVRRLTISTTLEKLEGDCLSKLRSLIFLGPKVSVDRSKFISELLVDCARGSKGSVNSSISMSEFLTNRGVRLLKVLDCNNLPVDTFPKFITTQYHLTYLNLSSTKVASIPPSIGKLRKLETLDLQDTLVEELPDEIRQLHSLRHLIVSRSEMRAGSLPIPILIGAKLPMGIETLTSLQTLSIVQGGSDLVRSLGELKQLRNLKIQQLSKEHGLILCSSIEQMSHLHRLEMESREEDEILDVQHISSPPLHLIELFMYGHLVKLPDWVAKLQSLARLSLKWSKLKVDPLESLQALPNLVTLEFLDRAYDGEDLHFRSGSFQMLNELLVFDSGLRRMTVEEGAMPRLQLLLFNDCKLMEDAPLGIEFLTNLKKFLFANMSDEYMRRLCSNAPAMKVLMKTVEQ